MTKPLEGVYVALTTPFAGDGISTAKLKENGQAALGAVLKAKPPTAKGEYLKSATLTSTMGPGIRLDVKESATVTK